MTTITETLTPRTEHGWRIGLRNLLSNEMNLRWGGRRWIKSALIWLAILNGFTLLVSLADEQNSTSKILAETIDVFAHVGLLATSIGAVVSTQGVIIREKQLGTAAWVLSKPASRESFILAKWLTYSFSCIVLSLSIPAVVFFVQSQILWNQMPALLPFVKGWLIMILQVQFYLALALLLGTIFNTRGPVTGIAMGFLLSGLILPNFIPQSVTLLFPWLLMDLAAALALDNALPAVWPLPVIVTAIWTLIFIALALWRFRREEF
ncbi:MAG TPA: ABC transporter permease subunit [Anaerolineales bacterium]|nr:ABC transporter permease subunit [Anaerolineales bacterium]